MAQGIAPLLGIPDALQAIKAASRQKLSQDLAPRVTSPLTQDGPIRTVTLDEPTAKAWLRSTGVSVPAGETVSDIMAAVNAADRIGYPVVLKVVGIAHKTEADALRLDLCTADAVKLAAAELFEIGAVLLVEAQIEDGVAELIVGAAMDPVVGLHLVIGSGGILVELANDVEILILPASEEAVRASLSRLKVDKLLAGYRRRPAGDIDAAVNAILAIQRGLLRLTDQVMEMDINPLIVRPKSLGAVAVDALIRMIDGERKSRSKGQENAGAC